MRKLVAVAALVVAVPQISQADCCPTCSAPVVSSCKSTCCSKDKGRMFEPPRNRGVVDNTRAPGEYISGSRRWGLRPLGLRWNLNFETPQLLLPGIISADREPEYLTETRDAWADDRAVDDRSVNDCGCSRMPAPAAECTGALEQLKKDELALRQQIQTLREASVQQRTRSGELTQLQQQIAQQQQIIAQLQSELAEAKACVDDTLKQRELDIRLARMAAELDKDKTGSASAQITTSDEPAWETESATSIRQVGHQADVALDVPAFEGDAVTPRPEKPIQRAMPERKPTPLQKKWWLLGR